MVSTESNTTRSIKRCTYRRNILTDASGTQICNTVGDEFRDEEDLIPSTTRIPTSSRDFSPKAIYTSRNDRSKEKKDSAERKVSAIIKIIG